MFFLIIGLCLAIYAVYNYKKAFCIFLIYKVFLVTNITVISVPGIPMLTLDMFLTVIFLILFLCNNKIVKESEPFPYRTPFKILAFSWIISSVFAYVGFMSAISQCLKDIFSELILVWLMWKNITRKSEIIFLLNGFILSFFITCIYGFYEYTILSNPLADYEATLVVDQSKAINFQYSIESGRGYRVKSVFEHAIGAGANWVLFIILIYTLVLFYGIKWNKIYMKMGVLTTVLCFFCVFLSNSRSPLLFLFISSLAFIDFRKKNTYLFLILSVSIILVAIPFFASYEMLFLSFFDSNAQAELGGSDFAMRLGQLNAALALMLQSPLVGFGFKFTDVMSNSLVNLLWGLESVWFGVLTKFGLIGVAAYLIYAYYSIIEIPIRYKSPPIFFLSLGYWALISITTVPGMLVYFYFFSIIIFIKLSSWKIRFC